MRGDTAEGGAKGCKARRSFPNVLQMVYASRCHGISLRKQKDSGSGLAFVPASQVQPNRINYLHGTPESMDEMDPKTPSSPPSWDCIGSFDDINFIMPRHRCGPIFRKCAVG